MRATSNWMMVLLLVLTGLSSGCSLFGSTEKKITGSSTTATPRVELNTAHRKQLAELPGLTTADADKIIAGRPYANRRDLLRKGVLTEGQFNKVKDSVYVEHAKE